jgi:hypothetical protein
MSLVCPFEIMVFTPHPKKFIHEYTLNLMQGTNACIIYLTPDDE